MGNILSFKFKKKTHLNKFWKGDPLEATMEITQDMNTQDSVLLSLFTSSNYQRSLTDPLAVLFIRCNLEWDH